MKPKTTLRASQRSLSGGNRQHVLRGGSLRFTQSESDVGKHAVAPTVKPKASADDRAATPTNTERPWIHETMWVAGQTAATAKAPSGRRRSRQLTHPSVPKLGCHPDGDVALVRFRSRSSSNASLTFSSPRTQGAAAGATGSPSRLRLIRDSIAGLARRASRSSVSPLPCRTPSVASITVGSSVTGMQPASAPTRGSMVSSVTFTPASDGHSQDGVAADVELRSYNSGRHHSSFSVGQNRPWGRLTSLGSTVEVAEGSDDEFNGDSDSDSDATEHDSESDAGSNAMYGAGECDERSPPSALRPPPSFTRQRKPRSRSADYDATSRAAQADHAAIAAQYDAVHTSRASGFGLGASFGLQLATPLVAPDPLRDDEPLSGSSPLCTWEALLQDEVPQSPFGWFNAESTPTSAHASTVPAMGSPSARRSTISSRHAEEWGMNSGALFAFGAGSPRGMPPPSLLSPAREDVEM